MFVRQRQKCDLECEVWPQTYAAITTWLVWLVAFLLQLWGKNKPEESFINLWIWLVWYEDIYLSFLMPIKFLSTVHSFLRVCWSIRTLSVLTCYDIKVVHPLCWHHFICNVWIISTRPSAGQLQPTNLGLFTVHYINSFIIFLPPTLHGSGGGGGGGGIVHKYLCITAEDVAAQYLILENPTYCAIINIINTQSQRSTRQHHENEYKEDQYIQTL